MCNQNQNDLFEMPNLLPEEIKELLQAFENEDNTYEACSALESALKSAGYSIEWGLDAEPFNLQRIV
jgi:hypothetical protein